MLPHLLVERSVLKSKEERDRDLLTVKADSREELERAVLMKVKSVTGAFALGLVWGWLPCGLVYSVLIWSIGAGSAVEGALRMFFFGLGTHGLNGFQQLFLRIDLSLFATLAEGLFEL